jgi:hypothetical protein
MKKILVTTLLTVLCCSCAQRGTIAAHPAAVGTKTDLSQAVSSTKPTSSPGAKSHTVADPYGPQNTISLERPEGLEATVARDWTPRAAK